MNKIQVFDLSKVAFQHQVIITSKSGENETIPSTLPLSLPLPQRYFRHPSCQGQAFGFKEKALLIRSLGR